MTPYTPKSELKRKRYGSDKLDKVLCRTARKLCRGIENYVAIEKLCRDRKNYVATKKH